MKSIQSLARTIAGIILLTMSSHTLCDGGVDREGYLIFENTTNYPLMIKYWDKNLNREVVSDWIAANGGKHSLGKIAYKNHAIYCNIAWLQVASQGTTYTALSVNALDHKAVTLFSNVDRELKQMGDMTINIPCIMWKVYGWSPVSGWYDMVDLKYMTSNELR